MMSITCDCKTWRPWFLIAIFLLDFSSPVPPRDDVINRLYGADLVSTATFLCAPIPPRLPASVNTHGVNISYAITLLIILLTTSVDPTCDLEHKKFCQCKVLVTENNELRFYFFCCQPSQARDQIVMLMFAVGVVEMLLLMAGDVEQNPGPVVTELEPSSLATVLTELLEAAAEWENIGLALGFLPGTLDTIKGPYKSHRDCLRDMLKKWLNTSHPCWEHVIESLRSPLVGMESLANCLEQRHCNQQSLPGTSTHGLDSLDAYSSYLKRCYLRNTLPAYGKLPASPSKKYTRLASVLKESVTKQQADEFTKETIHGNIDDIAKKKTSITMEEIAFVKDGVWPKLILVEGAPGIGKTTFAWEMCRKWSKGEILNNYKLVVTLRLRERKVREVKCVSDLFCFYDTDVQQDVVQRIAKTGGRGVLLLFEGYDELPAHLRTENSFFLDVIKGSELPEATVLVTSRPSVSGFLYEKCKDYIDQHIEILGFTLADIQSYLNDTCGKNESFLSGIQKYLQWYPHIRTMMYVPLNAGIVVEVYRTSKENNSVIPKTKTQLYQCLVCSLLRRYLSDHPIHGKKQWSIRSFEDLPEDIFQQFCEVARIADEGVRNKQQVIFNDLPGEFDTLGLMQCVPELYVDSGAAVSHSFPHLTIQEFMAAYHISQSPSKTWVERLRTKTHSEDDNERMVKQFLSGLTNLDGINVCHEGRYHTAVDLFHMIFEAQIDYPSINHGSITRETRVAYPSDSSFDWYVLGYCIARSDRVWKLEANDRHIGDEAIEGLVQGVLEYDVQFPSEIAGLELQNHYITSEGCRHLLKLPTNMLRSLKTLSLRNNTKIGNEGCARLVDALSNTIVNLDLSNTGICRMEDYNSLNKLLTLSSALKTLDISENYPSSEAVELVFSGLQASTKVKGLTLSMSCSQFSSQNCKTLALLLQNNNSTLKKLNLERKRFSTYKAVRLSGGVIWGLSSGKETMILKFSRWPFTAIHGTVYVQQGGMENFPHDQDTGIHSLDYALGYCVSHTKYTWEVVLCKSSNFLADDGPIERFVQGVLHHSTLPQSTISRLSNSQLNGITSSPLKISSEGVKHLLQLPKQMLCLLKSLSLKSSCTNIGNGDCAPLVEMLPTTLVHLELSNVGIGVDDCKVLNKLLTSSSALETLDITENYLTPEAVELVFSGLQASTGLKGLQLSMSCSQFSSQNYKALASLLQNNNGTLTELNLNSLFKYGNEQWPSIGEIDDVVCVGLSKELSVRFQEDEGLSIGQELNLGPFEGMYKHKLKLQFLPGSSTAIRGSVTQYHTDPKYSVTTLYYVLGYCVSHTTYTWDIELSGYRDMLSWKVKEVEDSDFNEFVQGILAYEAQPQSTVSSLTIHHGRITSESVQKIPKHMLSSLKTFTLGDSPSCVEVGSITLNTMSTSLATLETVDLKGSNLSPEGVAVILNGLQKMNVLRPLKLIMTCSHFSMENCQSLASVLRKNMSILRLIGIYLNEEHSQHHISLRVLPGPLTAIYGSVDMKSSRLLSPLPLHKRKAKVVPQYGCVTPGYILGYCVSHTSHTWAIDLAEFGDTEMETFMQGILGCESQSQCQSNISSLSLKKDNKLTWLGVNQLLKLPKHTLSSLKFPAEVGGFTALIQQFKKTLVELHLGGNEFDTKDCQILSKLLVSSTTLEVMDVEGSLSPEGVDLILSGLHKNTGLKTFSICCSLFTLGNCKPLVSIVEKNNGKGTLRALHVTLRQRYEQRMDLQFFPGPVTGVCGAVTNVTAPNEVINTLNFALGYCVSYSACVWEIVFNFGYYERSDQALEAFVDGVQYCDYDPQSTITSLSLLQLATDIMFEYTLTSAGIKYLLQLPKHMLCSLNTLSLKGNLKVGIGGCASLVEMLPTTLIDLDLSNTGIGECDCRSLNKLLTTSSALELLDVSENYLSPEAVEQVLNGIQRTTGLRSLKMNCSQLSLKTCGLLVSFLTTHSLLLLSVNNCNIGSVETEQLAAALMCMDTLQSLSMANNPIGDDGVEHLCRYLHQTKSLQTLELSECSVGLKGAENLMTTLQQQHNTTLETLILPDRFSGWIPEILRSKVKTQQIGQQKSHHQFAIE